MRVKFSQPAKFFLTATILYGFAFSFWELFFNLYMVSNNIAKDQLGAIRAVSPLIALIFGIPLGKLADRIGYRKSMLIGLFVGLGSMVGQVVLQNFTLIIIMGIFQGAGLMLFRISTAPFIMQSSSNENRSLYFSLIFSSTTLAGTIGNLVGGLLPGLAADYLGLANITSAAYQLVLLAGIIFGATSLIPLALIKEINTEKGVSFNKPLSKLSEKQPIPKKFLSHLFLANMLLGLGAGLIVPYLNVFFREAHNISDQSLGILFSLSSLLVVTGSLIAPWIARKLHSKIFATILTQAVAIIFLLILGFSPWFWLAQISFLLRTVFMQLSTPLMENFTMEVSPPGMHSTFAGIRNMGFQVGQAIGLFISGFIQIRYGFSPLFITTAILYVTSITISILKFRPKEKELARAIA